MSLIDLGPGEFTLADKLQPNAYIQARGETLRRLYGVDPTLARDVVSMVYPHAAKRPWADGEIRQQLGLGALAKAACARLRRDPTPLLKLANEYLARAFPSLSAAFSAYDTEHQRQQALAAQYDALRYPGLHATQPELVAAYQQQMAGGGAAAPAAPTHHHRRHRHHAG